MLSRLLSRSGSGTVRTIDRLLAADPRSPNYTPTLPEIAELLRATGADFHALCAAADFMRERTCGDEVSYVVNRNINFTNVCVKRCRFCAFSRTGAGPGSEQGYLLPLEDIVARTIEAADLGATEVCVQAGLLPNMQPGLYEEIARAIKAARPGLHLHAFSPEEVIYGASRKRVSVPEFIRSLRDAGVDSLPGTSAEILGDDALRKRLAPGRLMTADWIGVVRAAHGAGLRTTSTMMYGHLETPEHIARHLVLLREIQADTGGFTEFVPLGFIASEAPGFVDGTVGTDLRSGPSGLEVVRTHAVARIVLHGMIDNIQASWVKEGTKMAQLLLGAGCNDMGGTLINESISTTAGAGHGQLLRPREMRSLIEDCGRVPYQRLTDYRRHVPAEDASPSPLDAVGSVEAAARFGSYQKLASSSANRFAVPRRRNGHTSAWAGDARGRRKGAAVTFSPSITIVPTYECFNLCSYCNFRTDARRTSEKWLTLDRARSILESAPAGTVEVLVMSGEVHPGLSELRAEWIQRIADLCEMAFGMGFMPHTNVGPLSREEYAVLRPWNYSMGLMLEQSGRELAVHRHAPSKRPEVRIEAIRLAGELGIPFTTGILCGIGETQEQRLASLETIAALHAEHGHIQECILQPHSEGTRQRARPPSGGFALEDLPDLVHAARRILPDDVRIQVPPNLLGGDGLLLRCVDAGARDLGGISLVHRDEVNPDFAFPGLGDLTAELHRGSYTLHERLPVYPVLARRFLAGPLRAAWERREAELLRAAPWGDGGGDARMAAAA